MVRREADPDFINRIVNSAAVRPFIDYSGTDAPLDYSAAVGRPAEVGIVWLSDGEDALSAFALSAERTYQVHIFFGERCRGRKAISTAKEMLAEIEPYANVIWGMIPLGNRHTRWFARQVGFLDVGRDETEAEGPVAIVARVH
jgi:hypothetical protein